MRSPLPFPFSTFNTGSHSGGFAGLNDIVELSLADRDGHAGITIGMLGFADLGRMIVFSLGSGRRLVSSEPIKHYSGKDAGVSVRSSVVKYW